jgi:hypothetical protein
MWRAMPCHATDGAGARFSTVAASCYTPIFPASPTGHSLRAQGWNGPSGLPWNHLFFVYSNIMSWAFQNHFTGGQNKRDHLAIFFPDYKVTQYTYGTINVLFSTKWFFFPNGRTNLYRYLAETTIFSMKKKDLLHISYKYIIT